MRTRLMRGKFTLLFMMLGLLLAVPAIAFAQDVTGSTTPVPTVQSDKEDYAPGELVTLTGGGWQPGESVNIVVNDDEGQTWNRNVNVIADPSGNIADSFNLPDWFVATYTVTATGVTSGTATTTFTDGNVTVQTSGPTVTLNYERWTGNGCTGTMTTSSSTSINSSGTQIAALAGNAGSGSYKLSVPSTAGTKNFQNWTGTASAGTSTNNPWCLDSVNGNRTITAIYGPPTVTIDSTSPSTINGTGSSTITWHADTNGTFSVRVGGTNCTTGTQVASGNYTTQPNTTTSSVSASSLSEGANTIRVCVTDPAVTTVSNTGSATTTVTKDTTAPSVLSIIRLGPSATNAPSVTWGITFSESVSGVNIAPNSDFALVAGGGLGGTPAIQNISPSSGSSTTYTVVASTGSGSGSLGLNLNDNDSITDAVGNRLGGTGTGTAGGTGTGNGSKVGEVFTIDRTAPNVVIDSTSPATINSTGSSTITWHANENGTFSVRVGGTNCTTGTQVASGNYTTQPNTTTSTVNAADLADGSNTVRVCVTDAVGPLPNTGSATTTITKNPVQTTSVSDITASTSTYGGTTDLSAKVSPAGAAGSVAFYVNGSTTAASGPVTYNSSTGVATLSNYAHGLPASTTAYSVKAEFTSSSANYTNSDATNGSALTVNKKTVTGSFSADDKVYDGTTVATGTRSLSGAISGDDVSLTGGTATFDNRNVGPSKTVTLSGASLSGADAGNYVLASGPITDTAAITAKPVTGSFTSSDKVYDGTTDASTSNRTVNGKIDGDSVDLTGGTATFADKNVGPNKTVTLSGATLSGDDASNYNLTSVNTATAAITQASLDISAVSDTKGYDGTTASSGTPTVGTGQLKGTDSVTDKVQQFQSKNVLGSGNSTLEVTTYTVNDGNSGGNYDVTTHTASGTINKAALDISAASDTKDYDATTASSGTPTASGLQGTDTVTDKAQQFQSKNVLGANGSTLEVTTYTVNDGNSGGNYNVSTHTASGTINKAALDISAVSDTKGYDGTTASSGTPTVGAGQLKGTDSVTDKAQQFQSKNVLGSGNSTLEVTTYTVNDDNSGGNYDVTTHTASGTINKAALDITAVSDTKGYDGTTASSGTPTASGLQGTDTVTDKAQQFQSKDVLGTGNSTLEVTTYTVNDGNSGGNYAVTTHTASGTINKAALDITAVSDTKVYDGTKSSSKTPTVSGLQGTTDTVTGKAQQFQSKDVLGTGNSTLEVTTYTVNDGNSGGNYAVTTHTASGTINKAPLTVTADNKSKKLGDPNPTFTASYSGFVPGENQSVLGGTLTFATNVPNPEQVGTWDITPSGLTSSNYTIGFVKGTLTITYKFDGFRPPVDNPGTGATPIFNSAKAGQAIPIKFSLSGNQGLDIIAAGYPKVTSVNCVSSATVDPLEEYATVTANGGLNYDAGGNQYNYVWKTQSAYANKCFKFDLTLKDGTSHVAYFKFLK